MNWLQILGPIILQIVQALINRKTGLKQGTDPNAEMDRMATELEGHMARSKAQGMQADGLIVQVQALIAAFRAHDLLAAWKIITQILTGDEAGTAPPA